AEPNFAAPAELTATPVPPPKANLLTNGAMDAYAGGVATGWTAYRVNDPAGVLAFGSDGANAVSGSAQAIWGIGSTQLPVSGLTAAGVQRVVSGVTPGKVYQFVAYQDLLTADFGADGHRYVMNFGVHPTGGTDPGALETSGRIGGARWMTPSQAFWNDNPGSAAYFSGFHRSTAAFAATGPSISLWSGLTIDNAGVRDNVAARFDTDHAYLFEWDLPANTALRNGSFEGAILDLQDG